MGKFACLYAFYKGGPFLWSEDKRSNVRVLGVTQHDSTRDLGDLDASRHEVDEAKSELAVLRAKVQGLQLQLQTKGLALSVWLRNVGCPRGGWPAYEERVPC